MSSRFSPFTLKNPAIQKTRVDSFDFPPLPPCGGGPCAFALGFPRRTNSAETREPPGQARVAEGPRLTAVACQSRPHRRRVGGRCHEGFSEADFRVAKVAKPWASDQERSELPQSLTRLATEIAHALGSGGRNRIVRENHTPLVDAFQFHQSINRRTDLTRTE
ncbi:MAG: hypothetical protein JWM11_7567 [Planctomycetaceae bacterium]|nr:hypothetical protein [Planctomycetaceae bacterium]